MKMKAAYGVSRSRDKKGVIVKQTTLDWVNCLHANCGGGYETMWVLVLEVYEDKVAWSVKDIACNPMSDRVQMFLFDDYNQRFMGGGIAGSVTQTWGHLALRNGWKLIEKDMEKHYRIRKLTPRTCFRLMGVSEKDIDLIQEAGISDTQQYKLAGNSIVVQVLEGIFRNMRFSEEPLRVFEAFAGYGSQSMALRNIGVNHEVVGISEIDKYAIMAYNATHGETRNFGDIAKIDWGGQVPDFHLFTYSFPCTDISNAGAQAGFDEGSGTRSSLLWECRKAILAKHPKYLLMENVKAITSKKFLPGLLKWQEFLTGEGYTNFIQILNAKDYGIPQNRERCFLVSFLGDAWYEFPEKQELKVKLKDLLEENVAEKYYLDQSKVDKFISQLSPDKLRMLENE